MHRSKIKSIIITFVILWISGPLTVNAGFFDDLANDAKNIMRGTANDVAREQTKKAVDDTQHNEEPVRSTQPPAATRTPVAKPRPQYDRKLVADIQQSLNRLGYSVGTVDGLYGAGTRRAIEQYQYDGGLRVDGVPSSHLQANLQANTGGGYIQSPSSSKVTVAGVKFPDCRAMFEWAVNAYEVDKDVRGGMYMSGGYLLTGLKDEHLIPVYNKTIDTWSDTDLDTWEEKYTECDREMGQLKSNPDHPLWDLYNHGAQGYFRGVLGMMRKNTSRKDSNAYPVLIRHQISLYKEKSLPPKQEPAANSLAVSGSANMLNMDIVGLKLGMSKDEIIAIIKSNNGLDEPGEVYRSTPGLQDTNHLAVLYAGSINKEKSGPYLKDEISIFFPSPPSQPNAIGISRRNSFTEDDAPALERVKKALLEKYGPPSREDTSGSSVFLIWNSDQQGAQVFGKTIRCAASLPQVFVTLMNQSMPRDSASRPIDEYNVKENCGVNLTVNIYSGTKNYIKLITVTMVDHQQVLRDIKATDQMVAEHEKKLRDKKKAEAMQRSAPAF